MFHPSTNQKGNEMKITTRTLAYFAALALGTSLVQAQDTGTSAVKYRPDEIKYTKTPAGLETAVLFGNPMQTGLFVTRIKFPAGFKVPTHWHPDVSRTVMVLSGTLYFGLGERWDETKLEARPAGTFFSEAPKAPHFGWAKDGEVVIQVTGIGPSGTVNIEQPK